MCQKIIDFLNQEIMPWITNLSIYLTIISFIITLFSFLFTIIIYVRTDKIHLLYKDKMLINDIYKNVMGLRNKTKSISENSQFNQKEFAQIREEIDGALRLYKKGNDKELKEYIKEFNKDIQQIYRTKIPMLSIEMAVEYHCKFSKFCSSLEIHYKLSSRAIHGYS